MKLDTLVVKRLQELNQKALLVLATKQEDSEWGIANVDESFFQQWAVSVLNLLMNIYGETSVHYTYFKEKYDSFSGSFSDFKSCLGIFLSAKEDYEGGYVFNMRSLVSAEVIDNVIEQSRELLRAKYKDPAAVVAGVALESALKELCNKHHILTGKLDKMNADLSKAGAYNLGQQKIITAWADIRNNAAHGNWQNYSVADVESMIEGVNRFIAEKL